MKAGSIERILSVNAGLVCALALYACGSSGSGPGAASAGAAASTGGSASGGRADSAGGSGGSGAAGAPGSSGNASSGGAAGAAGNGAVGGGVTGGSGALGGAGGGANGGSLPPLSVSGSELRANGKKVILRGSSLIDLGALYVAGNNNLAGITTRIDKLAAAGVQGHVVRLPVYPKLDYNGGYPYCSGLPYPVGTGPTSTCTPTAPMTAADYYSKVLKPAVDYATSKNLYVIIDFHQIDDVTTGSGADAKASTSAADALTFWTDIAPKFASYSNVLFEVFNEPIDTGRSIAWAQLKPVVQGWVDVIRKSASNVIIVPSISWDQHPGDAASDPPTGGNLMYTAHIYPNNWNAGFKAQMATAAAKAPIFLSEWGYVWQSSNSSDALNTSDPSWGSSSASQAGSFQSSIDGYGASWTAWVTDNSWAPAMFADDSLTTLTDFGSQVKAWLSTKAASDWVQ